MELIHTENAEDNFIIQVYAHDPDMPKPKTKKQIEEHEKLQDEGNHIQGTHSYEVYKYGKHRKEPFFTDSNDIWSIEQALTLAYQDIPEYENLKEQDQ